MEPINYILNVKNPIEEAIKGYTMGRNDIAQRQELQIQQQNAAMQQQAFADQQTALAEQRAAAAQQQAQAAAYQQDLMVAKDEVEKKTWTAEDAAAFKLKYATNFDEVTAVVAAMDEPKLAATRNYNISVVVPLFMGDTETALKNVDERIAAAEASGNVAEAQAQRAFRQTIVADPYAAGLGLTLTSNASNLFSDDLTANILKYTQTGEKQTEAMRTQDAQLRSAGIVPRNEGGNGQYELAMGQAGGVPEAPSQFRPTTADETAKYGAPGQIEVETNRYYPIPVQEGISFTTNPDGTTTFTQGSGVGGVDVRKPSQNYVYGTDAAGRQVAQPIAGTPEALQVTETAGKLDAAIEVGNNMLGTIESIVGRPAGNGLTAIKPNEALPGILGMFEGRLPAKTQAQADLLAKVEQVQGQAFLEAFSILKGAGAITEQEGIKATQAYARLQRTQSPEAFAASLNEFADIVRLGIKRAQDQKLALPPIVAATANGQQPTTAPVTSAPANQGLSTEDMQYLGVNP